MRKKLLYVLLVLISVFMLYSCLDTRASVVYESPHEFEQLQIDMLERVMPTVVYVKTEVGSGSGIIFKKETVNEGFRYSILTNHHVIADGGEMSITTNNFDVINVADYQSNEFYDIAVIRVITNLELSVHSSPALNENKKIEMHVGQFVYAVGTPYSFENFNYATSGILSLLNRNYYGINNLAIMHNAELNPGNSGGPLFNLRGDLLGINVAKVATIPTTNGEIAAEGLNYTLNINTIAPIVRGFSEDGFETVERKPRLGVTIQEVDEFLKENSASLLPANPVGVVVVDLDKTRNAYGKIEVFDLIVSIDGHKVSSINDLAAQLANAKFGDVHTLEVMRKVGSSFEKLSFQIELK